MADAVGNDTPASRSAKAGASYRLSATHLLRIVGVAFVGLGLAWLVGIVAHAATWLLACLAFVTVVSALAACVAVIRPPAILRLDSVGYRVSYVRGSAIRSARWRDVQSVETGHVRGTPSLVITLAQGRSIVPLTLLGARQRDVLREVHDLLDAAHGYHPISWRSP